MRKLLFLIILIISAVGLAATDPGPIPRPILTHTLTEDGIKEQIRAEAKQRQYDAAENTAANVMRRHGCGDEFAELVGHAAVDERIPARLLAAVVVAESTCRAKAVSRADGVGLMQVVPRIWGVSRARLRDPNFNVRFATHRILAPMIRAYGVREGLRHYNGLGVGCSACSDDYPERVMKVAGYTSYEIRN